MMRKILLLSLILIIQSAFSQDTTDEAIILNEEMQFLENSASNIKSNDLPGSYQAQNGQKKRVIEEESLEKTYFKDSSDDSITSKMASPRKRRN